VPDRRSVGFLAALTAAAVFAWGACSKPKPPPPTACDKIQKRAERCEKDILDLIKSRIAAGPASAAEGESEQQYKMFETRFKKKIRDAAPRAQCERFRAAATATARKQLDRMTACSAKPSCPAFAECILELGEL